MSSPKIGANHAQAWLQAGGKEVSQVLAAFPRHSVQPVEEPGLFGNQLLTNSAEQGSATAYNEWLNTRVNQHLTPEVPTADYGRER